MHNHTILLTKQCNQRCSFCDRVDPTAPNPTLRSLLNDAQRAFDNGVRAIRLSGGESTLVALLHQVISACKLIGFADICLETNATLLSADNSVSKLIKDGLTSIQVTLPSVDEQNHLDVTGQNNYNTIIDSLVEIQKSNLNLTVRLPIWPGSPSLQRRINLLAEKLDESVSISLAFFSLGVEKHQALEFLSSAMKEVGVLGRSSTLGNRDIWISPENGIAPCLIQDLTSFARRLIAGTIRSEAGSPNSIHALCASCSISPHCMAAKNSLHGLEPRPLESEQAQELLRPGRSKGSRTHPTGLSDVERFFHVEYEFQGKEVIEATRIGIIYECNQTCLFCELADMKIYLPKDKVTEALRQSAERGAKRVILTGGEPTLSPSLAEYIEHATQLGYQRIEIQSNAVKLSDARYNDQIVDAGLTHAQISLHGSEPVFSDHMTASKGTHQKTMRGIENLLGRGVHVTLNHLLFKQNLPALGNFINTVAERWNAHLKQITIQFHIPRNEFPTVEEAKQYIPRFSEHVVPMMEALELCQRRGLSVAGLDHPTGIPPLCLLTEHPRLLELARKKAKEHRIHAWEEQWFTYAESCHRCAVRSECLGIPTRYLALFGHDEFIPVGSNVANG